MGWSFFKSTGEEKSDTIDLPNQTGLIVNYVDWFNVGIPEGWLLCYGQAVSRTTYEALFRIIGTTYGAGNGSTTFNVPDLRGAAPIGDTAGAQDGGSGTGEISGGTAIASQAIGTAGGATNVRLKASEGATAAHRHYLQSETAHRHTISDPGHTHNIAATVINVVAGTQLTIAAVGPANSGSSTTTSTTTGGTITVEAAAPSGMQLNSTEEDATLYHPNRQPWKALLFLIKT